MTVSEMIGIAGALLSGLLAVIIGLVTVVYRNDQEQSKQGRAQIETRLISLEKQNTEQETRIATLSANYLNQAQAMDRLVRAIDRLDEKIDQLTAVLGKRKENS